MEPVWRCEESRRLMTKDCLKVPDSMSTHFLRVCYPSARSSEKSSYSIIASPCLTNPMEVSGV
ncbi:unnamed protein product [Brassica oleracea var. botrytis]